MNISKSGGVQGGKVSWDSSMVSCLPQGGRFQLVSVNSELFIENANLNLDFVRGTLMQRIPWCLNIHLINYEEGLIKCLGLGKGGTCFLF